MFLILDPTGGVLRWRIWTEGASGFMMVQGSPALPVALYLPHKKGSILLGFSASLPACCPIASLSLRSRVLSLWVLMHILPCNGGALVLFVYAGSRFELPLNLLGTAVTIARLMSEACVIFLDLFPIYLQMPNVCLA